MCMSGVSKPKNRSSVQVSKFIECVNGVREKKILKSSHTQHGDCVSANHYILVVPGRLPNTYGQKQKGFLCGTLFVDRVSGKFSTSANSPRKRLRHFKASIDWKHMIATKVPPSKDIIWRMRSLHQEVSRWIATTKSNRSCVVVLVNNTRMMFPSKTSRRLSGGQEQVYYMLLFIGLHMPQ